MKYTVTLRDNETGEVRDFPVPYDWKDGSLFWWSEGNMSCDCNRGQWFHGPSPPKDFQCTLSRYDLLKITLDDGTVLDDRSLIDEWRFTRTDTPAATAPAPKDAS